MTKDKKIESSEIIVPKGWKYLPFGDVFEFIQSNALSREQLTFDEHEGEIFNIHYGDIHATYKTDILDFDKEEKVPRIKDVIESKSLAFLKEGDLVIADASEDYKGVAANLEIRNIKNRKVTGGLHTFVARDKSGLTVQGFRTYILKNPAITTDLKKLATGSKVYGVSKTNLATLKVLLPTEKEQIKIAKILSTWDNAIESLEQLIAKKERAKKALMQQLLTGKKRFKEFKGQKWKSTTVSEIADIKRGASSQYLNYVETGIRLLRINDFMSDSPVYIEHTKEISKFIVTTNDILIAGTGATAGITMYVDEKYNGLAFSYNAPRIRCNESLVNPLFIYYALNTDEVKLQQKSLFTGNAQPFLDIVAIGNLIVPKISMDEQNKITSILFAADEEIKTIQINLNHLKSQKQGLMQQLLTGKIRAKI
jgi:type I restriction enzyme, S subunit